MCLRHILTFVVICLRSRQVQPVCSALIFVTDTFKASNTLRIRVKNLAFKGLFTLATFATISSAIFSF